MANLGLDYIEKRNAMILAVTTEDLKRVGKRLFGDKKLIVTVVGKPVGMKDMLKAGPAAEPANTAPAETGNRG